MKWILNVYDVLNYGLLGAAVGFLLVLAILRGQNVNGGDGWGLVLGFVFVLLCGLAGLVVGIIAVTVREWRKAYGQPGSPRTPHDRVVAVGATLMFLAAAAVLFESLCIGLRLRDALSAGS